MYDILVYSGKIAPVIAVLWLAVRYFLKKEKSYQNQIEELHKELRANERETLTLMNRLTNTLDKVIQDTSENQKDILDEIRSLHKDLTKKLSELKNR